MSDIARRTPAMRVFAEQLRVVGLSLRGEALLAGVLLGFLSIGLGMSIWHEGTVIDFRSENHVLFGIIGALLPFAVWKGRDRLEEGAFLTMPVAHDLHALLRVFAGWVWLMIVVSAVLLWLTVLVTTSGGNFAPTTPRLVLEGAQAGALVDRSLLREVQWTMPGWQWLLPYTGSTITYALTSALNVGTRHPLRVVGAVVIAMLLLGIVTGEYVFEWLRVVLHYVLVHPWGLDTAVTGGSESLKTLVSVPGAEYGEVSVWRDLPTPGAWLGATLLWSMLAATCLWAATLRLREKSSRRFRSI